MKKAFWSDILNKIEKSHIPNDRILRLIGIPLTGFFVVFLFDNEPNFIWTRFLIKGLIGCIYTFFIWHANRMVFIIDLAFFPSIEKTKQRIIFQIIASILVTILILAILEYAQVKMLQPLVTWEKCFWRDLKHIILVTAFIGSIYESRYFFQKWNKTKEEIENLKIQNTKSQLESLKNQVNPHFLFNSLNTMVALIDEDTEIAKKYVLQLSDVYRYILQAKEKDLTLLTDELTFLNSYAYLLQIRHSQTLKIEIDIPPHIYQTKIPPLTLQILLENAVKHNVISISRPLTVIISVNETHISMKNNLQIKKQTTPSSKIGLVNIAERYQLTTEKNIEIFQTADFLK